MALVAVYLALGGSSYEPTAVADPCRRASGGSRRESRNRHSSSAFRLSTAPPASSASPETLAAALAPRARGAFATDYGIEDAELETAVRAGIVRAVDDAEQAGALNPLVADGLRLIGARIPVDEGIALIEDAGAVFEDADGFLGGLGGDVLDLLP